MNLVNSQQFTEEAFVCDSEVLLLFMKTVHDHKFVPTPSIYFEGMGDLRNFDRVLEDSIEEAEIGRYTQLDDSEEDSLKEKQIRDIQADPLQYYHDPRDDGISSDEEEGDDPVDSDWDEMEFE